MIRIHIKKDKWNGNIIPSLCHFESRVTAIIDEKEYNAKSIMSSSKMMEANEMDIVIEGEDENQVEKALRSLFW